MPLPPPLPHLQDLFIEHANVHGNMYGTSKAAVEDVSDRHQICILDIDVQGVRTCKRIEFDVGRYIFVAPPTLAALEERLTARGTETAESIATRLANAELEMEAAGAIGFDHTIVNDDLEKAYEELRDAVRPLLESREAGLKAASADFSPVASP